MNGVAIYTTIFMLPSGWRCNVGCDPVQNSIPSPSKFMPRSHQTLRLVRAMKLLCWEIHVDSPFFTLLHQEMPTNGVAIYNTISMLPAGQCCDIGCILIRNSIRARSKFVSRSHQTFCPVWAMKVPGTMLRNRCWPIIFHTITTGDANKWCLNQPVWSTP